MQPQVRNAFPCRWYSRDDNAVPPAYILASISTHLPDFISMDRDRQKVGKEQWWKESEQMQHALESAATRVFDQETARKYIISVTEAEVEEGLLKAEDSIARQAIWLRRNIEDIDRQESSYALSRYTDVLQSARVLKRRWKRLTGCCGNSRSTGWSGACIQTRSFTTTCTGLAQKGSILIPAKSTGSIWRASARTSRTT
ncbi:hypothetical protein DPMN_106116 [Dreissena polymorpha]|uniref:Uncharacterized protein n=1 Tax=Dreissena polymorpha TaxID=45954 RepID=A0A9D4K4F0_DREPO|nr:hypothetical protein DPMN_106115 [Dreissena polymorpha]KAH3832820.1 hypothetical protein DPMN_106116 [Dreissena polymorpha]